MKYSDLRIKDKRTLKLSTIDNDNKLWFIIKDKRDVLPSKDDILDIESYGTIIKSGDCPLFVFLFRINKDNNRIYTYYINSSDKDSVSLLEQLIFQRIYYFSFVDEKNKEIRKFYYINNLKQEIKRFLKLLNNTSNKKAASEVAFYKEFEIQLFNKLYMKNRVEEELRIKN